MASGSPGGSVRRIHWGGPRVWIVSAVLVLTVAVIGVIAVDRAAIGSAPAAQGGPFANEVASVGQVVPASANSWQVAWVTPSVQLTGVAAFDPTHVWVAGSDGLLYAWDGTGWNVRRLDDDIAAMAAVNQHDAWVSSDDGIRHLSGSKWSLTSHDGTVTALAALDASHAWAASASGILAWNGSQWSLAYAAHGARLDAISALDASHAWAVGSLPDGGGVVVAWNGFEWSLQASVPVALSAVYAADARHAWAVSREGSIYAWNGTVWQLETDLHQQLTAVAGTDAAHVWASTSSGQVLFRDGTSWDVIYHAPTTVTGLAPLDAANVWAIGFDTVYGTQTPGSSTQAVYNVPGF